jgi:hypothetical protein
MRLAVGAPRTPAISVVAIVGMVGLLALVVVAGLSPTAASVALLATTLVTLAPTTLVRWRTLIVTLLLVILFIPIQRYKLPGNLPFDLEPYRLLVAFLLLVWVLSLLADPSARLRRSGLEAPLALIAVATIGSVLANSGRIHNLDVSPDVLKTLTFSASYFLVFYLVVSVVRSPEDVDLALKVLAGCGALIAVLAVIESRTQYNVFDHLSSVFPLLKPGSFDTSLQRGAEHRAFGPAQHPIALGALLVILVPVAGYVAYVTRAWRWRVTMLVLATGALAGVSRTTVVMLVPMVLVMFVLRPVQTKRLWPALIPAVVLIHFAVPGTLGTLKASFFPQGGLVASQKVHPGSQSSAGRIADIGPSLDELSPKPLFGLGLGTRITTGIRANDRLLDDQWLGILLDTGVAGLAGWAWLFLRFIRRAGGAARHDLSSRGWRLAAITSSVAAFGLGMFLFDAFSFIQVNFVFIVLLALGAVTLAHPPPRAEPRLVT